MSELQSVVLQWARQRLEQSRIDIELAKEHIEHVKGRGPPVPGMFRVPADLPELELELEFMLEIEELHKRQYIGVLQGTYRSQKILEEEMRDLLAQHEFAWQIWEKKEDRREEASRRAQEARWEEAQRINEERGRVGEETRHAKPDEWPSNSSDPYETFLRERDQAREELRRQQRERFETQGAQSQQDERRRQQDEQRQKQNDKERRRREEEDRHRRRQEQHRREEEADRQRRENERRRQYAEQQQRRESERRRFYAEYRERERRQQEETREQERRQQEDQHRRREESERADRHQYQQRQSNDHQGPQAEVPPRPSSGPQPSPKESLPIQQLPAHLLWAFAFALLALCMLDLFAPLGIRIYAAIAVIYPIISNHESLFPQQPEQTETEGERQRAEEDRRRQDEQRSREEERQRQDHSKQQQERQRRAQEQQRRAQEEQRRAQEEQRKAQEERRRRDNEQRRRDNQQQSRQHTAPPPRPTSTLTPQQLVQRWREKVDASFADYRTIREFPCPPHLQACRDKHCSQRPNFVGCKCNIAAAFRMVPGLNLKKENLRKEWRRWHPDRFSACQDRQRFRDMANEIFVVLGAMLAEMK